MKREQFTFYESFFTAISRIKKKSDRADAYDAICSYALHGVEPDLDALPDAAAMAYIFSKPVLDASRRKAANGKRGGECKQTESKPEANGKQNASKPEANGKQNASKPEANRKQEKEQVKEQEQEREQMLLPPISPCVGKASISPPTFEQVEQYAKLRGIVADPRQFFDYYAAAGWRDAEGKPVYSWQQKLISWDMREREKRAKGGAPVASPARSGPTADDKARMERYLEEMRKQEVPGDD